MTGYLAILLGQLRGAPAQVRPRPRARFELAGAPDGVDAAYVPVASAPPGEPRAATIRRRDVPPSVLPGVETGGESDGGGAPDLPAAAAPASPPGNPAPATAVIDAAESAASRAPARASQTMDQVLAPERQVSPDQPDASVVQPVRPEAPPPRRETLPPLGPDTQRPSLGAAPVAVASARPPAEPASRSARRVFAPTGARETTIAVPLDVADPLPDVTVVIGRLDVRLERVSPLPRGTTAHRREAGEYRASDAPSLDEYLRGRQGR